MTAKVVEALRNNGLWDNTLIVATADNGGPEGSERSQRRFTTDSPPRQQRC